MLNLNKKDDEEEEKKGLSEGFLNIMRSVGAVKSNEDNMSSISNSNNMNTLSKEETEINPYTGLSNGFTNILINTTGIDKINQDRERTSNILQNMQKLDEEVKRKQIKEKMDEVWKDNDSAIQNSNNSNNNVQQEQTNPNANSRFRVNGTKAKEKIDQQIQQASSQNVQPNTNNENNNSIVDNDVKIGLASQAETQNAQELTQSDIQAMSEANKKNENIEKGGLAKFEEMLDTFFDSIYGGVKQTVSGLANVVTTGAALGLRGLEGVAGILGLENARRSLNNAYNSTVETGSNINEIANYERTVNSQVKDDLTRTVGDVTNVISNMVSSQVIGYALPSNVPGVVIQGLSVGGNSAQEVLDENKDNIGQATLTGIAKGYTSYLTEKMFDANILTRGMKKEKKSIQNAVDKLISDKINSQFGKEAANRVVGILGENAEELVEDNIDNIIDNIINKKDTPKAFSEEWWANTSETAKVTTISTIVMSLLGLGGESFHDKEVGMEADYWIDQAQQIIEQEDMAIHFNPSEVKTINDTKEFYITRFTPEGEIANIVSTRGKTIANPNQDLNVKPAIVRDNITNMYNVIDEDTGVVLDSTPYETTMEAESGFDGKVNKLSDLQIRDINQKISNASYMVNNEFARVINEAKNELSQMTPADYGVNTRQNTQQNQEQERQIKNFESINKTINQISDKSIYNQTAVDDLLNTVSNNINNVEYVQEDNGGGILYSFDNDRNITGQQTINGKVYSGKKIKNIVNAAIQNADTTNLYQEVNTDNTQTSLEPNESNFYTNQSNNYTNDTGYAVQDIESVITPFDNQESYSRDELADVWNDKVSNNNYDAYYDSNGNIERYIAIEEEGNNIVVNQYDNNDNLVKSEVIPSENGRYRASDIQDTLNRVASLYDENRPIKGQQDIEGNEVKSMKKNKKKTTTNKTTKSNTTKTNKYNNYSQKEIQNLSSNKVRIAKKESDITSFVKNARLMSSNIKLYFGKVSNKIADMIDKKLGINVHNYNISLKNDDIRKIFKDHGTEKTEIPRGQVPITEEDFLNIPEIINNPDNIERSGTTQQGKPAIKFEKNINGNNVVIVYVSDKHNNLEMQTMYKFKNNKNNRSSSSTVLHNNQNSGLNTSKTGSGTNTPNTSIPQNAKNVKNDGIRSMKSNNARAIDSEGRTLTKQQQEYFKDSKVRDKNR